MYGEKGRCRHSACCFRKITFITSIFHNQFVAIYHQITRFIQGYVDNEVNMNEDKSCKQTCSDYTNARSFGCAEKTMCSDYGHIDEASIRCKGTIYNCDFVDDGVTVCPVINALARSNLAYFIVDCFSYQALQKLNTRRYDYVHFGNGKTFGKYGDCLQTARVCY